MLVESDVSLINFIMKFQLFRSFFYFVGGYEEHLYSSRDLDKCEENHMNNKSPNNRETSPTISVENAQLVEILPTKCRVDSLPNSCQ